MAAIWIEMTQPAFWLAVVEIIWINVLLSGDNAVVIALACRGLPPRERRWAMILGAGVAVALRLFFAGIVSLLLTLPYLKIVGALLLLWIAAKLLAPPEHDEEGTPEAARDLWRAVRIVTVADVVMSLDNVIALAAAAKGQYVLLVFGLAVSIPIVVAGSAAILSLFGRFPTLIWGGSAILGWVAGDIFVTDPIVGDFFHGFDADRIEVAAQIAGVVLVLGAGWILRRASGATPHRI